MSFLSPLSWMSRQRESFAEAVTRNSIVRLQVDKTGRTDSMLFQVKNSVKQRL